MTEQRDEWGDTVGDGYADFGWDGVQDAINVYYFPGSEQEAAASAERERNTWLPINLAQIGDRPQIQPVLGNVGLVYPGKRHVFSGPQESAKTLAAYAIALEVIRNGGTVVIIDFEMGRWDALDRLRELGATDEELERILYLEPEEPAKPEHIAHLVALRPDLVIIDAAAGAYDLQGLDDNKRQDVERFTRAYVRDFWRAAIATIVIDHVVKAVEGRSNYAIGSERKVGGADVHLGFEVKVPIKRGQNGLYKVVTHKDRGGWLERGHLADLHLASDPVTHQITWEFRPAEHVAPGDTFRPTVLMEKVSRYLEELTEPVSISTIEEDVSGKRDYIRKAVNALISDRRVTESSGPRKARMVISNTPYRDGDEPLEEHSNDHAPTTPRPRPGGDDSDHAPPRPEPPQGGSVWGAVASGEGEGSEDDPAPGGDNPHGSFLEDDEIRRLTEKYDELLGGTNT